MFEERKIVLNNWQENVFNIFVNSYKCVSENSLDLLNEKNNNYKLENGYQNLIYNPSEFFRGFGKSYLCMYIGDKFKYDVFVETSVQKKVHQKNANIFGFDVNIYNINEDISGIIFSEIVILDDLFIRNVCKVKKLGIKNMIGFIV